MISICLLISFVSCKEKYDLKHINQKGVYLTLFAAHDSLPIIAIDFRQSRDSVLRYIESKFDDDICWRNNAFRYITKGGDTIKLQFFKECGYEPCIPMIKRPIMHINMNKKGEVLANNSVLIKIDSLNLLMSNLRSLDLDRQKKVLIKWQKDIPLDSIEKVFSEIKKGYFEIYHLEAIERHDQSIFSISASERDSIQKDFPYRIFLDIGRFTSPPPPPSSLVLPPIPDK